MRITKLIDDAYMLPRGLLKEFAGPLAMILRLLDAGAILAAGLIAYYLRFQTWNVYPQYSMALALAALLTLTIFSMFNIYESMRAQKFWSYLAKIAQALCLVLIILAGLTFFTKSGEYFSRIWFVNWAGLSVVFLLSFRGVLLLILRTMRAHHWNERRVIIIGANALGEKVAQSFQQALWTGFRVVAIFSDEPEAIGQSIGSVTVTSLPENISAYLHHVDEAVDEVWLALPLTAEIKIKALLHQLRHHPISIRLMLDVFGFGLLNNTLTNLAGFPALNLNASPMVGMNRIVKALEDRLLAAIILLFIAPLMLLIAALIKITSKGPVFYQQKRHGWDGKVINIYKFRTMYVHSDESLITQATANDKRITPLGRFLRRTSLDELPQFINVLQGRMSIVGPRPHALSHNEYYKESITAYMQRHRVKPGITGWAQINGWRGETEILVKMEKRVEYDLYYIENWSLLFDLKIILLTVIQGFRHKNAY